MYYPRWPPHTSTNSNGLLAFSWLLANYSYLSPANLCSPLDQLVANLSASTYCSCPADVLCPQCPVCPVHLHRTTGNVSEIAQTYSKYFAPPSSAELSAGAEYLNT